MIFFKQLVGKLKNNIVLRHSFWAVFGSVILRGSGLVTSVYVAKIIGVYSFGQYGMFKNFVLSLSILSTFGLGYSATKFVAENLDDGYLIKKIIYNANRITYIVSVTISLFVFFFSDFVAVYLFKDIHLSFFIKIVAVWIFFNALTTLQQAILSGFSDYKLLAKINIIIGILTFITSIVLTTYYKLYGALMALLIIQIINFGINFYYIFKKSRMHNTNCYDTEFGVLKMMKLSLPITLTELSFSFFSWLGSYLIISYSSYYELGIYNAAMQWFLIILFIPGSLKNVLLSSLSSNHSKGRQTMSMMLKINIISTVIPSFIVIIFSSLISSVYGQEFLPAKNVIKILSITSIFSSMINVFIQFFISKSYFWSVFFSRFIYDLLTLISFVIVIKYLLPDTSASLVMAIVFLITSLLYFLFLYYIFNKNFGKNV